MSSRARLSRAASVVVGSLLLPLVLTRSDSTAVVTLGPYNVQTPSGLNVPGLLDAVVMSMVPVLFVCLFARRALVQGLMGVGGK
jgi:xylobiose transport system permease protein